MIKFDDGVEINVEGRWRIVNLHDGLYVVGHGTMLPIEDRKVGEEFIKMMEENGYLINRTPQEGR